MSRAIISRKFQVVIPREIRRKIGLKSGQILQIISRSGVITMVPDQAIRRMRGYLKGMDTNHLREKKSQGHPRRGGSR